jgi:ketosteroid isomerase-like protein
MSEKDDIAAIGELLQRWIQAFCAVDGATMVSFWPENYSQLVYQSEENHRALSTVDEIRTYWEKQVPATLDGIVKVEDTDIRIHVHGEIATAYLYAVASAKFPGSEHLYVAPFRASIVLRRFAEGWKYIHYHESRVLDLSLVTEALNEGGQRAAELAYGTATPTT